MIEAPNGPGNLLLCPLYRLHQGGRVARVGCPEGQAFGERRPGRVGGLGDAEVAARLLGVLPELLVGHRVLRRRGDFARAAAASSCSQQVATGPRRHTSATSPGSIVYW